MSIWAVVSLLNYITRTNELSTYAEESTRFLEERFGTDLPRVILEAVFS